MLQQIIHISRGYGDKVQTVQQDIASEKTARRPSREGQGSDGCNQRLSSENESRLRPALVQEPRSGHQPPLMEERYVGHQSNTGSIFAMTSESIVKGRGFRRCRWKNAGALLSLRLEGYAVAVRGAGSSGCETTHACWWRGFSFPDHLRNPRRTAQTRVVRAERRCRVLRSHRLTCCVYQSHPHSATCDECENCWRRTKLFV